MDDLTRETVDYIAVRRLQDAYADIATRRAWPELTEIFLPTCRLTVDRRVGEPMAFDGPEAVGAFIDRSIAHIDFFEFVIFNARVFLYPGGDLDTATARMYINELRHEDGARFTHAYGLYQDTYRRVDRRWWFAARNYASLARTGRDFDVFGLPPLEPTD